MHAKKNDKKRGPEVQYPHTPVIQLSIHVDISNTISAD
jgi:hypothetical protein